MTETVATVTQERWLPATLQASVAVAHHGTGAQALPLAVVRAPRALQAPVQCLPALLLMAAATVLGGGARAGATVAAP